jgi:outer membrane protein TolC
MKKPKTALLAGAVMTAAVCITSPVAAKTVSLSQQEAVSRALARHPTIAAAKASMKAARAKVGQARTGWYPRVKVEAKYMLIGPVPQLEIDTGLTMPGQDEPVSFTREMGSLHNASAGVSVAWRAYDFGVRSVRIEAAQALEEAARAQGEEQEAKIAHATRIAYLATRFFEEMEKVVSTSLQVARTDSEQEKARLEAGVGDELAVARVEMRIAEISSRVTRARQERARAESTLRILLGLDTSTDLVLTDDLRTLGRLPLPRLEQPKSHPMRKRLEALRHAAKLEDKRLGRAFWPTLDVVGSFKYQYPKNLVETDEPGIAYTAGVVLTWRVFDGDLRRRKRHEAEAKVAEIEARAEAVDEEIRRKAASARAKAKVAAGAADSAKKRLAAAKVYLQAARASHRAGTGTGLEVKKAKDSVDQASLALIRAYFDRARARAEMLLVLGKTEASEGGRE